MAQLKYLASLELVCEREQAQVQFHAILVAGETEQDMPRSRTHRYFKEVVERGRTDEAGGGIGRTTATRFWTDSVTGSLQRAPSELTAMRAELRLVGPYAGGDSNSGEDTDTGGGEGGGEEERVGRPGDKPGGVRSSALWVGEPGVM